MSGKPYTVYALRCETNGKMWIGVTVDLESRITAHFSALHRKKHSCKELQADYDKYGKDAFRFYEIEINVKYHNRREREEYYMEQYRTRDPEHGYNTKHPKLQNLTHYKAEGLPPLPA